MATLHFTDLAVSRLKTLGTYYDQSTPAFGIRVGKNRKTWFVIRGKKRLRTNVGRYPDMPLVEARKEAKKLLTEAPNVKRLRFSDAYDLYKVVIETKKPRTQDDYTRFLDKLSALGQKQLAAITYDQVHDIAAKLSPSETAHCLAVARTFFRWCVRPPHRYIPHSPLEGLQVKLGSKRKRVLEDAELKTVWWAAEKQGYPYGTIVQLLMLNGQRRGEIANLRWPWINEKKRLITLPEWLTKNSKEHVFPYGQMTADLLEAVPRLNSTDLLFPSRVSNERPISGWSKYKKELGDGVEGWTLHDLRRTYRTVHGQIGTSSEIGERLINHVAAVATEVEQIYNRYAYIAEMETAVSNFEEHFSKLLGR